MRVQSSSLRTGVKEIVTRFGLPARPPPSPTPAKAFHLVIRPKSAIFLGSGLRGPEIAVSIGRHLWVA
jgi:hypothetical protein